MAEEASKNHTPTSASDLMTSAKTVAEAAQLAASQQTDKIDKAKVAGAAEDILEAAKSYGKLDENSGIGQYVGKAEGYLHQFSSSSETETKTEAAPPKDGDQEKDKASPHKEESKGEDGGLMNVAKGLGGFFK
ncbi:nodulin-related protein 1-like [Amaranthus tricolor]|uniref:nodulin-related protein 1-like n=1 Tax=Amaranthus tricolor TaxID=29722 RepID=UPI00258ECCB2|nr:nodulin-related protein 1-like [Amaranthus tricolor]